MCGSGRERARQSQEGAFLPGVDLFLQLCSSLLCNVKPQALRQQVSFIWVDDNIWVFLIDLTLEDKDGSNVLQGIFFLLCII